MADQNDMDGPAIAREAAARIQSAYRPSYTVTPKGQAALDVAQGRARYVDTPAGRAALTVVRSPSTPSGE